MSEYGGWGLSGRIGSATIVQPLEEGKKVVPVNAAGRVTVNEEASLMAACLSRQGVGQLLELYARDHIASGQLVQLPPDWADESFPLYAYHYATPLLSAKVRALLDYVVEVTSPRTRRP